MRAMARDLDTPSGPLEETTVFERNPESGPDRPIGPPDMPIPQGQNRYTFSSGARPLDGYTIKRAIGRGGFGEVYYATSDSGKEVALKLILRNLDVERRGVVQCMNLKCPNLLTIFDLKSNDAGETFVIMEYVAGASLANVLAQHPHGMAESEVRAWMKGLVEGVAYLHDHGIVHRDLKPANLFMEEGIVKIGDYGLAKLITPSHGTEHSESIGTCHYMAPEIASGKYHKPIDIYSIGVILFEMLTGRVPFEGETVGEVLMKHLTARPDVSMLPEPYRTIVAKALAKDPNQRPARIYDLLAPDDAPRAPEIRIIGKPEPAGSKKDKDDDILRIEAEEPIFYIGPDTRPPRPPINQRIRTAFRRPAPPVVLLPRPRPAAYVAPAPKAKVKPAPPPPPVPPELPGARVRVGELASSMLMAAPLAAMLAVPLASLLLGVDVVDQPERVAFLFGMSLLGTWGLLIPSRLFEGRRLDPVTRRTIYTGLGALVGLAGWGLASWLDLGTLPRWDMPIDEAQMDRSNPLAFAGYFALLGLLAGWPGVTARDRSSRLRLVPIARAGLVAAALGVVWPFPQPWGLGIAALTAVVAQSVSPWSEPAARYARYVAKFGRRAA